MASSPLVSLLPQLASGAAHTHALGLRVDYMRAAEPGRDLIAEARCYRLTHSIAFVRAWAFEDGPDDPVAAAQAAYMLSASDGRDPGAGRRAGAEAAK